MSALAPTLQAFFTDRLVRERNASPQTVAAYRDTWRLLLGFASQHTGKPPCVLDFSDLDVTLIGAFLTHLEQDRGNSARTRNARLAAIHSLYRYAALHHPEHAETISRILAIQTKRYEQTLISFLTEAEVDVLLSAPDRSTWTGRRDHTMLLVAVQTGLRVSELIGLCTQDVHLGTGAHLLCYGKGRKERITPLTSATVETVRTWLAEQQPTPTSRLFTTRPGTPLSRDAIERRIAIHTATAATVCPSLARKPVTAHVLRHYVRPRTM